MRNQKRAAAAHQAADFVRKALSRTRYPDMDENHKIPIGIVLGTGWGDALHFEAVNKVPLTRIPGFERLGKLEGHSRTLLHGVIEGQEVLALQGRVHLNEAPADSAIPEMVRLQVEMLFQLGVQELVLTKDEVTELTKQFLKR